MRKASSPVFTGIAIMLFGVVLLLHEMDIFTFQWSKSWPILILVVSLFNFIRVLSGEKKEIFGAIFFATIGAFFFLRNYGYIDNYWFDEFWPIFLIAPGLGCLGLFMMNLQDWGSLITGIVLLVIGGFFASDNFNYLQDFFETAEIYWPLVLVAAGLVLIVISIRKDHDGKTLDK